MIVDKNTVDLGRRTAWGNPYHGTVTNGTLTLPNGSTMAFNAGGECVLVALNGTPAPAAGNTAADAALGLRWDNYVLLQGGSATPSGALDTGTKYPGSDWVIDWTYKDAEGIAWRIGAEIINSGDMSARRVRVVGYRKTTNPASVVDLALIPIPTESPYDPLPGTASVRLYPAPNGSKALAMLRSSNKMSSVLELIPSGGSALSAPSIAHSIISQGADCYYYSDGYPTLGANIKSTITRTRDGWIESGAASYVDLGGQAQREIVEKKVLSACYDDAGNLIVFRYESEYFEEKSSVENITPSTYTCNMADYINYGTVIYIYKDQTGTTSLHWRKKITAGGQVISYAADQVGQSISHERSRAPIGSVSYTYPPTTVVVSPDWIASAPTDVINSLTPSTSGIIQALKPMVFSMSCVGFGIETRDVSYNVADDGGTVLFVVPAYHAFVTDRIGPKTHGATWLSSYAWPNTAASIVVHPITGEFAVGANSGFV